CSLRLPGRLEQLRVDDEANRGNLAEYFACRSADVVREGLLQPVLKKVIRDAHHELVVVPAKLRMVFKPEAVACLPNALHDGIAQRRHAAALAGSQGIPLPARSEQRPWNPKCAVPDTFLGSAQSSSRLGARETASSARREACLRTVVL